MSSGRRWGIVAAGAVGLLVLVPGTALACPVCFDPRDENRLAFLGTTIFLSLLPLGMVAGLWLYVRHQWNKLVEHESLPDVVAEA